MTRAVFRATSLYSSGVGRGTFAARAASILARSAVWVVEAEWSDSTLERVGTFGDYSAAADWIANQSEAWLASRRIQNIAMELRQGAVALGDPQS